MRAPKTPLIGRYRFSKPLKSGKDGYAWLAVDEREQKEVVVSPLPADQAAGLEGIVGLSDPHLATILDLIHDAPSDALPDGKLPQGSVAVAVAEYVRGPTLHERLLTARMTPAAVVEAFAKLSKAVESMHAVGGVHGAISPRAIVMEPEGRKGPVLAQLVAAADEAFCSPEVLAGGAPSSRGDTWQLHASLYCALTRHPPFGTAPPQRLREKIAAGTMRALSEYGVGDPALRKLLERGLVAKRAERQTESDELVKELEAWLLQQTPDKSGFAAMQGERRAFAKRRNSSKGDGARPVPPAPAEIPRAPGFEEPDEEDATFIMSRERIAQATASAESNDGSQEDEEDYDDSTFIMPRDQIGAALDAQRSNGASRPTATAVANGKEPQPETRAADIGAGLASVRLAEEDEEDATFIMSRDAIDKAYRDVPRATNGAAESVPDAAKDTRPGIGPTLASMRLPEEDDEDATHFMRRDEVARSSGSTFSGTPVASIRLPEEEEEEATFIVARSHLSNGAMNAEHDDSEPQVPVESEQELSRRRRWGLGLVVVAVVLLVVGVALNAERMRASSSQDKILNER